MGPYQSVFVACLVLVSVAEGKLLSLKKLSAGITRIHNFYRNVEKAANMQMMVWDRSLARKAAAWSENCYWGHQKKGLGENLAYQWSTGTLKPSTVILKAIKGWYNEKFVWRWSTQCGSACHYTQMVWAKTTKIGCAYSICNQLRTTGTPVKNAHYLVCFYNPPGNYYGQYPYWYGQKCTKCGQNDICRKGLCCSKADAPHEKYLPNGSKVEEQLTAPTSSPAYVGTVRRPSVDRNKIFVSVQIWYEGKILRADHIKQKHEHQITGEVMRYLAQKRGRFIDD